MDSNGLLVSSSATLWHKKLIGSYDAAELPGGILLAEGGMGKTTFMEQLKASLQDRPVHHFKLGEYVGDPSGFSEDLEASLNASASCTPQTVLLDGLDEAPDLAGAVLRKIRQLPGSTSVWLASRDIAAVRAIRSERPELISYSLAPLSETDLRTLASQVSVDGEAFLHAAERQGLLPICVKPLGCQLVLSVFCVNGLVGVAQRDLWQRGIERLCDETPSQTRQLLGPPKFTLDEIVQCSAWISLCLALSGNRFVWSGEQSHRPEHSLGFSDLTSDRFSGDLIRTAVERGVFYPLGDGRVTYSHAIYRDYLAAFGFARFIPAEHWMSLLMNGQRDLVFPQRAGIAPWLATYNEGFLAELSAAVPELLLSSADSVQAIGPDQLCEALLYRADCLSYRQRQNEPLLSNLHRLKDDRTLSVLRTCLMDRSAGPAAIELATTIVEQCEYSELSGVLAERVLDVGLILSARVDAARAVGRLKNDAAKRKLKELLPIDPVGDPLDDLRGTVLRACWPSHLAPDELVVHLTEPQKSNYGGAYSNFLNYDLPPSLEASLDEKSAVVLLNWAISHINRHDPFDALGHLARSIYTSCWKWLEIPAITELLAKGYVSALSEDGSPFLQERFDGERATSDFLTKEAFLENIDGRFAVLQNVLSDCNVSSSKLAQIRYNEHPLYTQGDLPALFERANSDVSSALVEQWVICIKLVISPAGLDSYAKQVDHLHDIRPDLIDDSQKLRVDIETADRRANELAEQWKKKKADREKEHFDTQEQLDKKIKTEIGTPKLRPESFIWLSSWLNSENGRRLIPAIDIQHSPGWSKLTTEEQNVMLDLAERFLNEGEVPPTAADQHQYTVAIALTALRQLKPSGYAGLSREVWQKCAVELLKAAMHDNLELLAPLFDTLSKKFPEVATDAVLQVLSQELQRGFISVIRNWGSRMTDTQAAAVVATVIDVKTAPDHRFRVLDELARHGKAEFVRTYLDSVYSGGWDRPQDVTWHKLRSLAFVLSPYKYIRQVINSLSADPAWGRQWIESVIERHDNDLLTAFLTCDASEMAEMYIWLHSQYAANTRPEHDAAYSPGPLDEIHMLKNHLISHLTQSGQIGSSAAIQTIVDRFPSESWLTSCVLDARTAECTNTAPVLTIAQINELSEPRSASCCLVNSDQDLMKVIMASLEEYRTYLQGDTPAVGDLWNTLDPIRPCDEDDLSNHLKRFLDLRLSTGVVINREVQIRRKQFTDGKPGSRTDIWIQAVDNSGSILTLCIEVKCNWNSTSKTALKDQLIGKYMSGGTATAGILLLGWFACTSWDTGDLRRSASTATWPDAATALADLQSQVEAEKLNGNKVEAIVLDCGLR